jgi:hypothetical protein
VSTKTKDKDLEKRLSEQEEKIVSILLKSITSQCPNSGLWHTQTHRVESMINELLSVFGYEPLDFEKLAKSRKIILAYKGVKEQPSVRYLREYFESKGKVS